MMGFLVKDLILQALIELVDCIGLVHAPVAHRALAVCLVLVDNEFALVILVNAEGPGLLVIYTYKKAGSLGRQAVFVTIGFQLLDRPGDRVGSSVDMVVRRSAAGTLLGRIIKILTAIGSLYFHLSASQ